MKLKKRRGSPAPVVGPVLLLVAAIFMVLVLVACVWLTPPAIVAGQGLNSSSYQHHQLDESRVGGRQG